MPLSLAVLGCGSRGRTYARIAASMPERYQIIAAADPVAERRQAVTALGESIAAFDSADALFAAGRLANVLLIATQDADHYVQAMTALELGYDILLEKPAATTLEECEALDRRARELGRRIALCFVLRYTPFYSTVKKVIESGQLGKIISIRAHEGVEPYHQAHSFVRGHWRNAKLATPMIVAKCSHDADLLCWLGNAPAQKLSSFGERSWFDEAHAPAGAPMRCTDGCPELGKCIYDSHRYLTDKRRWLGMVMDGADAADDDAILNFLRTSPWGRCVYRCDNDVVDHQVLAAELTNGVTVNFTMTAFDFGRSLEIYGSKAALKGGIPYHEAGAPELWLRDHRNGEIIPVEIPKLQDDGYAGHGGGDFGIIDALDRMFSGPDALPPGLDGLAGHRLAFNAERSRKSGQTIELS